jgi:hypothetical protein
MTDDIDPEYARLLEQLAVATTEAERIPIRQALADFRTVRDMLDPDGGTIEPPAVVPTRSTSMASEHPPAHYDVGSGTVTLPGGGVIDEEELRRHMHLPPPPEDPPAA